MVDVVAEAAAALSLIAIIAVVLAGITARYVFNASFPWTEELASWIFIWMIFIGMALGHRNEQHLAVGIIDDRLPPLGRRILRFAIQVMVAFATFMLMFASVELVHTMSGSSPGLQWPNFIKYLAIPGSCAVSLFYLAAEGAGEGRMPQNVAAIVVGGALYAASTMIDTPPLIGVSPSLIMTVAFFVTLFLGVPVGFALLLSAFLSTWGADILPPAATVHTMAVGAGQFVLLAIPFFLTAGALMNAGGLSRRLIDLAAAVVGHFRGGLAQVNILHSTMLCGICGSSGADAASTTKILVPEMVRRGYSPAFACAVTATGSILPNIMPPSIALLVYSSIAEVSVARLFVAGIVPGLVMTVVMMVAVHMIAVRRAYEPTRGFAGLAAVASATWRSSLVLLLAVVVVFSLRFGVITPTEIGVIAVVWVFVLGKFVYGAMTWREIYAELVQCAVDSAIIGFLIGVSATFAWVLIAEQIPQKFVAAALALTDSRIGLLLLINVVMLLLGTALEPIPAMLITIPLFLPLMTAAGVDPVHLGIIVVINLLMGSLTPPVGVLVFITAALARVNANAVFRECLPLLLACAVGLLAITYWPALSLTLWNLLD